MNSLGRDRWLGAAGLAVVLALTAGSGAIAAQPQSGETGRWAREARDTTIVRDDLGIAHVTGKTDADAVFGMIYAQAEDDFNRVETNYLNSMGRLAEAEGEDKVWQDLRMKLFIDPADLKKEYAASPEWLRKLMDSWADGLNFYLAKHPEVKPRVIQRFEPWMALSFTEGSIGGDIERIDVKRLAAFYEHEPQAGVMQREERSADAKGARPEPDAAGSPDVISPEQEPDPGGSNGIAIAPGNTAAHHALLLINPHTSFFFRSVVQMQSREGLDAYGAVTWGQFFVYQGFNTRAGWMHTSSGVDAVDLYLETVHEKDGRFFYKYGSEDRPVVQKQIVVPYHTDHGMAEKKITAYFTSHGPVIAEENGKWETIQLMQRHVKALEQSYLRTKATNYSAYLRTMELQANSSNNTVFADADGDIAYFHGNFIPRRDTRFDFTKPVDGSDPATDWHGLLTVAETPHLRNPKSGYLFNVNNWPWAGAGESSLKREDFPAYVETGGETERGVHATRLLKDRKDLTPESLRAAGFDSYLPWFEKPLPAVEKAWDALEPGAPMKARLEEQVDVLRKWDLRWGADSVATALGIFWGQQLQMKLRNDARSAGVSVEEFAGTKASPQVLLETLAAASDKLTADFGSWKTPWGQINRFQRLTGDIVQPFDDAKPSLPVGFTYSGWGSLASFAARAYPGTKKWYGTSGNSFVAVVEFGDKVRAWAITAGGESGHADSPHFDDEAADYIAGNLREVYFYPDQLKGHTDREYHPGAAGGGH